jgi:hypothetical protein
MAHWRTEYSAALAARDRREKANIVLYNACMLLDKVYGLATAKLL